MNIVFFDGYCAMCHWAVKWIAKQDTRGQFYFAPLQGITAKNELKGITLPDSLVFFENGKVYFYSKACFKIAWLLGGMWKIIGWLGFLPSWALYPTDLIYRLVAKSRSNSCDITISGAKFLP